MKQTSPVRAFSIVTCNPPGFAHAGIFNEVAETIHHGLRAAGADSVMAENSFFEDRVNIVFAPHLLKYFPGWDAHGLDRIVLFNLEQIRPELFAQIPHYGDLLRRCQVWEYDARNLDALAAMGVTGARHVRIGHAPEMGRIRDAEVQDIDVLFYGSPTARRLKLRDALADAGLAVHFAFGVYGAERDALIARSRLVVNPCQFDHGGIFDIVRLSYLLANRKAVVMEGGIDPAQEALYGDAVCFAPYEDLVGECAYLCAVEDERIRIAQRGHALFSNMPQRDFLRPLIDLPAAT